MSQIVSLIRLEDTSRCFTLKSTPIVDCMCSSNESSVNRSSIEDCGLYCIVLHCIALHCIALHWIGCILQYRQYGDRYSVVDD